MISVSERYEAHDLDPLCEGWEVGVGRDTRLDRPVVLARYTGRAHDTKAMTTWLTKRATLSHVTVAQLLDLHKGPGDFVCIFEGTAESRFGLPNLSKTALLQSCRQVLAGAETLREAGLAVPFFGGQVLWDGQSAKLLGLPIGDLEVDTSMANVVVQLGQYFGSVLEWHLLSMGDHARQELPAVWQSVIKRLLGQSGSPIADLSELRVILQTLEELPDALWEHDDGSAPNEMMSAADTHSRRRLIVDEEVLSDPAYDLVQEDEPEAYDDEFDESDELYSEGGHALRRRLLPWAIGVVAVAVMLLIIGVIVSQLGLLSSHNVASSTPAQAVAATPQPAQKQPGVAKSQKTGSAATAQKAAHSAKGTGAPAVTGLTLAQAMSQLLQRGVPASSVRLATVTRSGQSAGQVLRTSLAPGQVWKPGETVTVFVAVPAGEVVVPQVVGMTTAQASQVLLAAGLHYAYKIEAHTGTPVGVVFAQTPGAYGVTSTTTVNFSVAAHY